LHWIKNILFFTLIFFLFSASVFYIPAGAENNNIGFLLADSQGNILISKNKNSPLIPASTLKILTSLSAIKALGINYRYKTWFYYDKQSLNLFIKGFGDPLFISEEINNICTLLFKSLKTYKINNIILDNSFFDECINIPGKSDTLNPYDAIQGALCANFNTIFFKTDNNNKLISAEPQTPLLPIFIHKIKSTRLARGRITLSENETKIYPGLLIKFFLEKKGIKVSGKVLLGKVSTKQKPILVYTSHFNLKGIIQNLLKYSNNFMANQILLTMGAEIAGPPSNLKKSVRVAKSFFPDNCKIIYVEGSGISRDNRISCMDMMKVLIQFIGFHELMKKDKNGFYKTGTLSGVRTRAGYIKGKNKSLYPYIIMINQKNKNYTEILAKFSKKIKTRDKNF
jgi:D-alanyl-D-alanine carboxypeptidase/D-alanyl-D-alanine-endopeptidase (penicillin-binding protein 4)